MRVRSRCRHGQLPLILVAAVAALVVTGCGSQPLPDAATGRSGKPTTIRVLAASSLASVLPALVDGFRSTRPNVTVETSTGASTALVEQVRAGVSADLVLTADRETAESANGVPGNTTGAGAPVPFATNTMVIAVPAGNPGGVRTLDDLSNPDLLVGLCAPQVPCGKYARQLLKDAGVTASVDTEEPDARSLMAKIASGDLDAGLVYRTDALSAGQAVRTVAVPAAAKVPVTYFAVERTRGAAAQFVEYLRGPGRKVLAAAGFGQP